MYRCQCGTKLDIAVSSFRLLLSSENVTEKEAEEACLLYSVEKGASLLYIFFNKELAISATIANFLVELIYAFVAKHLDLS